MSWIETTIQWHWTQQWSIHWRQIFLSVIFKYIRFMCYFRPLLHTDHIILAFNWCKVQTCLIQHKINLRNLDWVKQAYYSHLKMILKKKRLQEKGLNFSRVWHIKLISGLHSWIRLSVAKVHGHMFIIIIKRGCRKWVLAFFKLLVVTVDNHPEVSWKHCKKNVRLLLFYCISSSKTVVGAGSRRDQGTMGFSSSSTYVPQFIINASWHWSNCTKLCCK
jgi:hypothetical protein